MSDLPTWVTMSGGKTCWATILLFYFVTCSSFLSSNTDKLALLAFKAKITDDPLGIMRLWNNSAHFCQCFKTTPLPAKFHRRWADCVDYNCSTYSTTHLSNCSELQTVSLSNNNLEGDIPLELGLLSKLEHFGASRNYLTGGIPPSLGNLTLLQVLFLSFNRLGGRIPVTLGSLTHLTGLSIGQNKLSGEVPPSIFNITSLETFYIGTNQLEGTLPSDLFNALPNLQWMSIVANQFTGNIPSSMSNASNIQILQLGSNNLTGKVPSLKMLNMITSFDVSYNELGSGAGENDDLNFLCSLTNASALQYIQMEENNFGGSFPDCVTDLSPQLRFMSMQANYITGSIPPGVANLVGLQVLALLDNYLTGTIPPTVGNLTNLFVLSLALNNLSGSIPSSLGKLSKLSIFELAYNNLEGTIPSSLSNCTSLQRINLAENFLIGSIPPQLFNMPSLSLLLGINGNRLTGELPEEVGKLANLNTLDVSENELTGNIPESLGDCTSLQYLYMYSNNFQGPIPAFLSSLRGLQELILSSNNLSGQIPEFLGSFQDLMMLNLSFNDLQGTVPIDGVFTNTSAISLQGNSKLCGGLPYLHLVACSSSIKRKKNKLAKKTKVTIAIVAGIAGVGLLVTLLFVFGLRRARRQSDKEDAPETYEMLPLQFVSYGDIHRATNGFSEENLIGMGNFGRVYKGTLREGGDVVAIKVLKLDHLGASKSFMAECEALRNIRHKNLVKLCSGVDYEGNQFKALVYELMSNGSLEDWLHPPSPTTPRESQMPPRKLSLTKRLSIACDVASLLEYLHYEFGTSMVHCDIKPSNILLDGDLTGRVSDFGLAKFLLDSGFIRHSFQPSSSVGVRGTVGYAPPEYGLGSEVSTQGDVYSFGILLLEMFMEKRPTHEMFKDGLSLHLYAKRALLSGVVDIVDPVIKDLLETEEQVFLNPRRLPRVVGCLESVIEIGIACSLESRNQRMDMSTVTTHLRRIRDNLATRKD